jgi:group II intron reverse transcriptase/maturase
VVCGRQAREGGEPYAAPQAFEESDAGMVPEKSAKTRVTPVEPMEGRAAAEGKLAERNAYRTLSREDALTHLARVGERAGKEKGEKLTNLLCHVRVPLLKEAYERLKKRAAPGVDGETWSSYGVDLDARLLDLEERVHRGNYHPQPVRRVLIAKGDGRTRPLGIPAVEDKILQQAVRMILEPIYESEFLGLSYGFRPGRSPHAALDALYVALLRKVNWVLDADIRSFFDTIDHGWMQKFVEHRIGDKRLVRLLMKWLHAGVMVEGQLQEVQEGTPQGGIISPLLSNIYLHYVLDLWVRQWRHRHARGQVYVVRYADDFVMGFQHEDDARAMREALSSRLAQFGLELHADKTRVLRFGRFAHQHCDKEGRRQPETFDFLGFTHISAKAPDGSFRLVRRTSRKKRNAKLGALREQMRRRKHEPVPVQHRWLLSVLRGHGAYYGVPGNARALSSFAYQVRQAWHRQLQRRSQRARWTAEKRRRFDASFPLPTPHINHPRPANRFHERRSRP